MIRLQKYLNKYYNQQLIEDGIIGNKTLLSMNIVVDLLIKKRNWKKSKTGLIWLRYNNTFNNKFLDFCLVYSNNKLKHIIPATTTPGNYYVYNPLTVGGITGTAVACEQQILNGYRYITNKNWKSLWLKSPYFKQFKNIQIIRDTKIDNIIDDDIITIGQYNINFHRMGKGTTNYNWSGGCLGCPDQYWYNCVVPYFTANNIYDFTLIDLF